VDRHFSLRNSNFTTICLITITTASYGVGYNLIIEKSTPDVDPENIIDIVQDNVWSSKFLSNIGTELTFLLPDDNSHQFPNLLDTLEMNKERLNINSFGLSVTTMEEVFLKIGNEEENTNEKETPLEDVPRGMPLEPPELTSTMNLHTEDVPADNDDEIEYNTGIVLYCQQFYALLVKHFYYTTRFLLGLVLSIALPLISLLVALLVIKFSNDGDIELSLTLPEQALSSNISFFWADFTSDSPVNFSASDASFINATNFFNFTSDVESIRSSVQNYTNITSCCSYQYQILDKYCASRTSVSHNYLQYY
jgi:ATP-binding cassette subfamily A (ABC1) protein 3